MSEGLPPPVPPDLLRVERVTEAAGLDAYGPAWEALASEAPQSLPQLSAGWFRAFLETLGSELAWSVHFAFAGLALVGVLALIRRNSPRFGSWASELGPPRDHHTRSGDALLHPVFAQVALPALVRSARREEGAWFGLALRGVRQDSPTLRAAAGLGALGVVVRSPDESGSWARVDGDRHEFRARLSENFRRNLRKAWNRAGRSGVRVVRSGGSDADPADLDTFLAVEASGWKGREGTAIASHPRLVAFYRALVARLAASGRLEWHRLELDGRPAAIHLAARSGRALVLLKIAYDESFARMGPGNLLFDRIVEDELATPRVDRIDCMTDMPWHRNWALERATWSDVVLHPRRALPILAGVVPAHLRALLRRWPRRPRTDDGSAPTAGALLAEFTG